MKEEYVSCSLNKKNTIKYYESTHRIDDQATAPPRHR